MLSFPCLFSFHCFILFMNYSFLSLLSIFYFTAYFFYNIINPKNFNNFLYVVNIFLNNTSYPSYIVWRHFLNTWPVKRSIWFRDQNMQNISFVVIRFMCMSYKTLKTHFSGTLNRKLLETSVGQSGRPNLYKSLV